jgi:hypothetical protein
MRDARNESSIRPAPMEIRTAGIDKSRADSSRHRRSAGVDWRRLEWDLLS